MMSNERHTLGTPTDGEEIQNSDKQKSMQSPNDSGLLQVSQNDQEHANITVLNDHFEILCSNCNTQTDVANSQFVPTRKDLISFLKSSFEGICILMEFEKNGRLSTAAMNVLTQLVINREMYIIFRSKKVTLKNPLDKLE